MSALNGWGVRTTALKSRPTSAGSRGAPATVGSEGRCAGVGRGSNFKKHGRYVGLRELARHSGLSYGLLQNRVRYGYSIEQALGMPLHARRKGGPRAEKSQEISL